MNISDINRSGPPRPQEPAGDVDYAGGNVIDLRPYLIREIADARALSQGDATDSRRPEDGSDDLAIAQGYLTELFAAGAALPVSEQLPNLIKRLRAERLAAFGLCDDEEV